MTHLPKLQVGTTARALAAALAIGATVLTLSTGPTAYAARSRSMDPGDTDPGAGYPTTGHTPGSSTPAMNINDYPHCTITGPDGYIQFYLAGDGIVRDGHELYCDAHGEWQVLTRSNVSDGSTVGNGGVVTQAP